MQEEYDSMAAMNAALYDDMKDDQFLNEGFMDNDRLNQIEEAHHDLMESLGLEADPDQEQQLQMIPDNLANSSEILK